MATKSDAVYANEDLQRLNKNIKVAVIGGGFLGKCIAIDLSLLGVDVLICDTNPAVGDATKKFAYDLLMSLRHLGYATKGMVTQSCSNIRFTSNVADCANMDLVIDAIPDDLNAKTALFKSLEGVCREGTLLATSTVELPIDAIQSQLAHPERFLGMRFFHPCVLIPHVEVSRGQRTSEHTMDRAITLLVGLQKAPHKGPTRQVLSKDAVSALQFQTAVRGQFYHGLLQPNTAQAPQLFRDLSLVRPEHIAQASQAAASLTTL